MQHNCICKQQWQEWQDTRTKEVFVMVPKGWFSQRAILIEDNCDADD